MKTTLICSAVSSLTRRSAKHLRTRENKLVITNAKTALLLLAIFALCILFARPANAIQITIHSDTSTLLDFTVDWHTGGDAFAHLKDGGVHAWFDPDVSYLFEMRVTDNRLSPPVRDFAVFFVEPGHPNWEPIVEVNPHDATWWDFTPDGFGVEFVYKGGPVPEGGFGSFLLLLGLGSVGAMSQFLNRSRQT
jgi:hypothetical protein